jgi:hypothetical protein
VPSPPPPRSTAFGRWLAIYMAGGALFRRVMRIPTVGYRAVAAVVALATVVLGVYVAAGAQLVCPILILVTTLVAEARPSHADVAVASTVTDAPRQR